MYDIVSRYRYRFEMSRLSRGYTRSRARRNENKRKTSRWQFDVFFSFKLHVQFNQTQWCVNSSLERKSRRNYDDLLLMLLFTIDFRIVRLFLQQRERESRDANKKIITSEYVIIHTFVSSFAIKALAPRAAIHLFTVFPSLSLFLAKYTHHTDTHTHAHTAIHKFFVFFFSSILSEKMYIYNTI